MAALFPLDVFSGFGPTVIRPQTFVPSLGRLKSRQEDKLRKGVRDSAPKEAGVYGMLGRHGELIYIGKAKSLRARLLSYFRESRDPKAGRILKHTQTLVWETVPDEFAALLRELELIRRHRPRFNVLGQPGRQKCCYVCLGRSPAPYAYVSRSPTGRDVAVYGPLTSASRASEAVRRLNDWYGLRDCSQSQVLHFAEQGELFPQERTAGCLRFELSPCSGACVGACSRTQYGEQVRAAKAFLDGNDSRPVTELTSRMMQASTALQFERAASLRDRLANLQWLADKLTWLRQARRDNTFVYPLTGSDQRTVWYLIYRGRVQGACYRPTTVESAKIATQLLTDVYGLDTRASLLPSQIDHVLLVSAWFRKAPTETAGLLTPTAATEFARAKK